MTKRSSDSEAKPRLTTESEEAFTNFQVYGTVQDPADEDFDASYPAWIRALSGRFWTPVQVARRAAEMLVVDASTRVLDVGSGAGKFCLVGALSTPGTFVGVEQRPHLVKVARAAAKFRRVTRATYIHGDMRDVDWSQFDAFYFFNPFAENTFAEDERIDDLVDLTPGRYSEDIEMARAGLERASIGTRVVTYYGLGRTLPQSYEPVKRELAGSDLLELWVKR